MKYYFAPLEGITGYIYRRAHHTFYPGMNRYYAPFIVPKEKKYLSTKERNDVCLEHNSGMMLIPQIMTNRPEEFLRISRLLNEEYGYQEINLNLGCPSKTVVSKKRGSGFLAEPDLLERFLIQVCDGLEPYNIKLSVKTRIGKESSDEFFRLLEIFAQIPLSELIVHPRLQKNFYDGVPDLNVFAQAYTISPKVNWELCYNGDLFQNTDYWRLCKRFPKLSAVMLGRGLLTNPMLVEDIKVRENGCIHGSGAKEAVLQRFQSAKEEKAERKRRYEMYRMICEEYMAVMSGENTVLFKMKELWFYMCQDFTLYQSYWKKMKKVKKLADFDRIVIALCEEQRLREHILADNSSDLHEI